MHDSSTNHLLADTTFLLQQTSTMSTNPWAKRDAWRYEGQFSRFNRFKSAFPGFGIAVGAFAIYLAYDKLVVKKDAHGHH